MLTAVTAIVHGLSTNPLHHLPSTVAVGPTVDRTLYAKRLESIPKRFRRTLVDWICASFERFVVFTAALPCCGCQLKQVCDSVFDECGFAQSCGLTLRLPRVAVTSREVGWCKRCCWRFGRKPVEAAARTVMGA